MATRAAIQRRDVKLARALVAPSARFADHLAVDYAYPRERIHVLPNPIDLERLSPPDDLPQGAHRETFTVLFVSRIAVRKGVEMIVELSHRLADLEGKLDLQLIGGASQWSNYEPLLQDLNPAVATYRGQLSPFDLAEVYRHAVAVVQPSRFEPFGLTVAESLATGHPVVASDEVGAVDGVDPRVCRVFPAGDGRAFAEALRGLLADLAGPEGPGLARLARLEAERLFSPGLAGRRLAGILEDLIPSKARP
jgi:glycosyltransferase involved in cell wall biosynthesis